MWCNDVPEGMLVRKRVFLEGSKVCVVAVLIVCCDEKHSHCNNAEKRQRLPGGEQRREAPVVVKCTDVFNKDGYVCKEVEGKADKVVADPHRGC